MERRVAAVPVLPSSIVNSVEAILFDRDGTLVHDVPYNGDPSLVIPMDDAVEAVASVRALGLKTAVVSNQSGVGRGYVTTEQVERVNERVDELFGSFEKWAVCYHVEDDDCDCRKPRPGLVIDAAAALGVEPSSCLVIGDIGADVGAARAAGANAVLVPTAETRRSEIRDAPWVAPTLGDAIAMVIDGR